MVMNVYRQMNRSDLQFDFLLKEKVNDGYEQEVKALGGHIFYVESPKKIGVKNYIKNVKAVIEQNGPYCAVHSHMNVMSGLIMFSAWLSGINLRISHSHSTRFTNSFPTIILGKTLIKIFANKKVACGQKAGKALFGQSKFSVIPNGIDTAKYYVYDENTRSILRRKLNMKLDAFQICHVGRFVDVKNHKFILEVARELKNDNVNFQVHLLGDGELFDEIHQMANEMNLEEVCFHGSVENVNEYLKASDLFILPSKYEGLPVTLVEAQSAGVKCLVSNGVPTEADFNLGLMEALPLEKDIWVTRIKQCVSNKKRIAQSDIESAIEDMTLEIARIRCLKYIYKIKGEEEYGR